MAPEGGESVADVSARLAKALATMEAEFQGYCSLLINRKIVSPLLPYETRVAV